MIEKEEALIQTSSTFHDFRNFISHPGIKASNQQQTQVKQAVTSV